MTAAARSFWPSVAGSLEKRSPAPFGSAPVGRSTERAAAAIAGVAEPARIAAGRTSWKSAQRGGEAREPLLGRAAVGSRLHRPGDRVFGRCRPRRRGPVSPESPPAAAATPTRPRTGRRGPRGRVERRRLEPAGRTVGGEDPDRRLPEVAGEVGVALGHRRADQRPDVETRRDHRPPEGDPVGDVGGEDDHVGSRPLKLAHDARPVRHREVVGRAGRRPAARRSGRRWPRRRRPSARSRRRRPRSRRGAARASSRAAARARSRRTPPSSSRGWCRSRRRGRRAAARARSAGRRPRPPPSRPGRRRSPPGSRGSTGPRSRRRRRRLHRRPSASAMTAGASPPGSRSWTSSTIRRPSMPPSALTKSAAAWTPASSSVRGRRRCSRAGRPPRSGCRRPADDEAGDGDRAGAAQPRPATRRRWPRRDEPGRNVIGGSHVVLQWFSPRCWPGRLGSLIASAPRRRGRRRRLDGRDGSRRAGFVTGRRTRRRQQQDAAEDRRRRSAVARQG